MKDMKAFLEQPVTAIIAEFPVAKDFFKSYNIDLTNEERSFSDLTEQLGGDFWEDNGIGREQFIEIFTDFVSALGEAADQQKIESLEVLAGCDKSGDPEACSLLMKPGEITCIVGPTGSGKSRLLADIEWLADADTPTKRTVLLNGTLPDDQLKNSYGGKLIAQITQNMNFVLDMDVYNFLMMHAQSRFLDDATKRVEEVIQLANDLSGEPFTPETPVTFLSGGQSRALMIADVACIGQAPIVLIDEIENAGVDKKKALELLISKEKIVLMATHDPLLILQADRRVVIRNGGMDKIIVTSDHEKTFYTRLEKLDATMLKIRNFFRHGNALEQDMLSELLEL